MQNEIGSTPSGKKVIKTSTGLIIVFAAVVIFFGGALAYWYYNDPNSYDTSKDATVVATKSDTNTNTTNANINANANSNNTNSSVTADWQTYSNTSYDYSLKYPSDWTYNRMKVYDQQPDSVLDSSITFLSGQITKVNVSIEYVKKSGITTLDLYAKDLVTTLGGGAMGGSGVVQSDTTVAGVATKKITVPTTGSTSGVRDVYYLLSHNDVYVTIKSEDNVSELPSILSTFQFTK